MNIEHGEPRKFIDISGSELLHDDELFLIGAVQRKLNDFDDDAKDRILKYLWDRYCNGRKERS